MNLGILTLTIIIVLSSALVFVLAFAMSIFGHEMFYTNDISEYIKE